MVYGEYRFPERPAAAGDGRRLAETYFLALSEGVVRGGYILNRQEFLFRGRAAAGGALPAAAVGGCARSRLRRRGRSDAAFGTAHRTASVRAGDGWRGPRAASDAAGHGLAAYGGAVLLSRIACESPAARAAPGGRLARAQAGSGAGEVDRRGRAGLQRRAIGSPAGLPRRRRRARAGICGLGRHAVAAMPRSLPDDRRTRQPSRSMLSIRRPTNASTGCG